MSGDNAGRRGSRYRKDHANLKAQHRPCWICGQTINYEADWPDPDSFSLDHKKSWIGHPELRTDPGNYEASHLRCNQSKGQGETPTALGNQSEEW